MIPASRSVLAFAASLALVALLAGCRTAPVLAPAASFPADASRTEARMAEAIKAAGLRYGWEMQDEGPGQIKGSLHLRRHSAVVAIPYDADSYHIDYVDSEMLRYGNGKIHRNYNRWVNNLSEAIKAELGFGK